MPPPPPPLQTKGTIGGNNNISDGGPLLGPFLVHTVLGPRPPPPFPILPWPPTFPQASRKADSILNHTLKNTMADAAGDIEMFLSKAAPNGTPDLAHLRQAAASLGRGMRRCRHRQAYLQLAAHRYQIMLQVIR